jgi:ABC-type phosphate/phosphonate transport system substrate-binding protein
MALEKTRRNRVGAALILTLFLALVATGELLYVVNHQRETANQQRSRLKDAYQQAVNKEAQIDGLVKTTADTLRNTLEGLWTAYGNHLPVTSEQLAALSGRAFVAVTNKESVLRLRFGLAANESPVDESKRYATLFAYLETNMSARLGREVRIDLRLYKFANERFEHLAKGELDLARSGAYQLLRAKEDRLPIRGLVEQVNPGKAAVFFTRTNSGIKSLSDLKGRSMAFGETNATISFVAQTILATNGIIGKDLSNYDYFDSKTEFMEDVLDSLHQGKSVADVLRRYGVLSSHSAVLERVIEGEYDAGVSNLRAFQKNERRGLTMLPGTFFNNIRNPWIASTISTNLPPEAIQSFISAMTNLHETNPLDAEILHTLPDTPTGYRPITEETQAPDRDAVRRIPSLFPRKPGATNAIELKPEK